MGAPLSELFSRYRATPPGPERRRDSARASLWEEANNDGVTEPDLDHLVIYESLREGGLLVEELEKVTVKVRRGLPRIRAKEIPN